MTYRIDTLQLHAGQEKPDPATGARAVPIYLTSSYVFNDSQHAADRFALRDPGNIYSRLTNPTVDVFEQRIAALDGGVAALATASGLSAITYAILTAATGGENVVAASNIYGGTYNLLAHTLPEYGVKTTFVDITDLSAVEQAIDDKLQRLVHQLIASLTQTIDDKKASLQHELELLQTLRTIPLSTFMNNFFADYGISEEYSFTEAKAQNSWNDQCQTFTSYVINRIEAAPTKDEAQKIMKYPEVQKQGQVSFSQCYDTFAHSVNHMRDYYEQLFEDFKQSFTKTFSIDAVDFLFQVRMKESWQRDYKLNFKKSGITTNFFLRWWKELPEIKEEMKTAVRPQISKSYRAIADYYSDKLQHINATLVGQLEQVKEVFIKKYSKTIQQRIVEEEAKMHDLENEIAKMETSLSTLSNPTFADFSR